HRLTTCDRNRTPDRALRHCWCKAIGRCRSGNIANLLLDIKQDVVVTIDSRCYAEDHASIAIINIVHDRGCREINGLRRASRDWNLVANLQGCELIVPYDNGRRREDFNACNLMQGIENEAWLRFCPHEKVKARQNAAKKGVGCTCSIENGAVV